MKYFIKPGTNYIVEWTPELERVAHQRGLVPYDPYDNVRQNPLERGLVIPQEPVASDDFDIETATKVEIDIYARSKLKQHIDRRLSVADMREKLRELLEINKGK